MITHTKLPHFYRDSIRVDAHRLEHGKEPELIKSYKTNDVKRIIRLYNKRYDCFCKTFNTNNRNFILAPHNGEDWRIIITAIAPEYHVYPTEEEELIAHQNYMKERSS